VAGDTSAASQAFSRDLLVKLGSLQSANASALQLASPDSGREHSTLYFNVTAGADPGRQQASLALFDARRRLLLWSKDFESPSAKTADLKQQVAYTAAKVLACASEGLSSSASRLSFGTLKLYLSGCADYADVTGVSVGRLVPIFLKVTREAPGFRGGWAKLLLAESDFSRMDFLPEAAGILKPLPGHIVAARKLDAQMAEAFVAEAALLPEMAFGHRLSLLRRAVEVDPDNSPALEILSDNLLAVGRMSDAIERAQRAVAVDPLSPTARDTLVAALIHSGKLDAALAELRRAEQLWPGATSITNARFRIDLRYGDAREAMRLIESGKLSIGDQPYMESFLEARSDPTPTKVERAVVEARSSYERAPTVIYHLAQVLGTFHREEELFPILLNWPYPDRVSYVVDALFRPSLRNVRRDPRMIAVAKRLGLLEYWQHSGDWPDFCFEPDLPYDCKKEAAKLKV
jgi:tetratricopeptide (TPR) repeat protein